MSRPHVKRQPRIHVPSAEHAVPLHERLKTKGRAFRRLQLPFQRVTLFDRRVTLQQGPIALAPRELELEKRTPD